MKTKGRGPIKVETMRDALLLIGKLVNAVAEACPPEIPFRPGQQRPSPLPKPRARKVRA